MLTVNTCHGRRGCSAEPAKGAVHRVRTGGSGRSPPREGHTGLVWAPPAMSVMACVQYCWLGRLTRDSAPAFLLGAPHIGRLCLRLSRIQTPRVKAGVWHKSHCLRKHSGPSISLASCSKPSSLVPAKDQACRQTLRTVSGGPVKSVLLGARTMLRGQWRVTQANYCPRGARCLPAEAGVQ